MENYVLCIHANFSQFYLGIFSMKIFYLFKCPWKLSNKCLLLFGNNSNSKCEYCLIWARNKSVLFGSNSLKLSVLCDMNSEKTFYYILIWKELYESVSIAWQTLENCVVLFASNSLKMSVLFNACKSVQYCLGVTPSKCQ